MVEVQEKMKREEILELLAEGLGLGPWRIDVEHVPNVVPG